VAWWWAWTEGRGWSAAESPSGAAAGQAARGGFGDTGRAMAVQATGIGTERTGGIRVRIPTGPPGNRPGHGARNHTAPPVTPVSMPVPYTRTDGIRVRIPAGPVPSGNRPGAGARAEAGPADARLAARAGARRHEARAGPRQPGRLGVLGERLCVRGATARPARRQLPAQTGAYHGGRSGDSAAAASPSVSRPAQTRPRIPQPVAMELECRDLRLTVACAG
jgi:hypothetical protein